MIRKGSIYVDSPRYDNKFNGGGGCWKVSGILEGKQQDKAPLLRIACHLRCSRPCFYHIAEDTHLQLQDHRIVDQALASQTQPLSIARKPQKG